MFGRNKILGKYTFTATFSKIGSFGVGLSVYDILNKNEKKNDNFVYYTSKSYCRVGDKGFNNGSGFKKNEKIAIIIDLNEGFIQWRVGS